MLRSEFENLTGIYPPENLFEVIQEAYTQSKLSKRDFCRQYKFNVNGLAKKIQQETNKRACQTTYLYGTMLGNARMKKEKFLDDVKKFQGVGNAYIHVEVMDSKEPDIFMCGDGSIILASIARMLEVCSAKFGQSPAKLLKAFTDLYGK